MRRARQLAIAAASASLLVVSVGIAQAEGPPPEHGHLLVTGVEYEGEVPVGFEKCRLLANGNALKLNAHHAHAHTGQAGEALHGANAAVVPLAPLTPWSTCEEFEQMVFAQ